MEQIKNLSKALVKAQSEMSNPQKATINGYFKSKYADLNSVREAVIPTLNANGISVLQPMVNIDGKNFIKTMLLHESGEVLESFTEIIYSKMNDAHAQGSGITYARRYGLQSLVCVGADDDDGNNASALTKEQIKPNDKKFLELESKVNKCNNLDELRLLHEVAKPQTQPEIALFTNRKLQLNGSK